MIVGPLLHPHGVGRLNIYSINRVAYCSYYLLTYRTRILLRFEVSMTSTVHVVVVIVGQDTVLILIAAPQDPMTKSPTAGIYNNPFKRPI